MNIFTRTHRAVSILVVLFLATSGCSLMLGREDANPFGFFLVYKETLRNEASLQGEGLKDLAYATDRAGTLQRPNSVFADQFRVYVTDATPARVFLFDRGTRTATVVAIPAAPSEGSLVSPTGIVADVAGTIFVSDSQQGRVFGYDRSGKLLYVLGRFGEFAFPSGLAIDTVRNRLYITDAQAHQVKVFDMLGNRLFDISGSGKKEDSFKFPGAVVIARNGDLYVLDTLRRGVYVYDPDGIYMRTISVASADTASGVAIQPKGVALDSDGHLYVTDAVSNTILVFDKDGRFLFTWGKTGSLNGDFWTPAGIFIDEHDQIYIADQTNGRVQVFQYVK